MFKKLFLLKLFLFGIFFSAGLNAIKLEYGFAEDANPMWRPTMEDAHFAHKQRKDWFFGVYDGHSGRGVSDFLRDKLHTNIFKQIKIQQKLGKTVLGENYLILEAIRKGFLFIDDKLREEEKGLDCGSCAITAFIKKDTLYVANLGDSRAVLCRNGKVIELSKDHKPDRPDEVQRINAAGGAVYQGRLDGDGNPIGPYRVNGQLAVSRAFGDFYLKPLHKLPFVSLDPEIKIYDLDEHDKFLILACDGVWDVINSQESVDCVLGCFEQGLSCDAAAGILVEKALEEGSTDNISVMVIKFDHSS